MRGKVATKKTYIRSRDKLAALVNVKPRTLQKMLTAHRKVPNEDVWAQFEAVVMGGGGPTTDRLLRIVTACESKVAMAVAYGMERYGRENLADLSGEEVAVLRGEVDAIWRAGVADAKAWPEKLKQIRKDAALRGRATGD